MKPRALPKFRPIPRPGREPERKTTAADKIRAFHRTLTGKG